MLRYHLSSIFGRYAPQTQNMKHLREVSRPFYTKEMLEIMKTQIPEFMRFSHSAIEADGSATLSIGYKNSSEDHDVKFKISCEWSDILQLCGRREAAFLFADEKAGSRAFYFGETWNLGSNETQKARKEYDTRKMTDHIQSAVLLRPCPSSGCHHDH